MKTFLVEITVSLFDALVRIVMQGAGGGDEVVVTSRAKMATSAITKPPSPQTLCRRPAIDEKSIPELASDQREVAISMDRCRRETRAS